MAYDLRTNKRVEIKKEDYITQHTGFNYVEPASEDVDLIRNIVEQILPSEDSRKCYISVLRSGMIGKLFSKIVIANGGGGNGKGLINNLFKFLLGLKYYYRGNITTITEDIKPGANPEIAGMHNCRTVIFSEPNDHQKLNTGTIKALTGDGDINARGLYQSNTVCRLPITTILECNKKPKVNGRIDSALVRRFVNIFFPSTFTDDPSLYENVNGYYKANSEYIEERWQHSKKLALFNYLLEFDFIDIYEPKSIREATRQYLLENDDFSIFMDKYYEETEDESCHVSIKQMVKTYKDNYLKKGTRAHKQMTKKRFEELLTENLFWKGFYNKNYRERYRINGLNTTNILIGLKIRKEILED
tara:strand:+ start:1784 stop:2860 length:1077 start_codon:yes stop_codon:yes gene_type:complete